MKSAWHLLLCLAVAALGCSRPAIEITGRGIELPDGTVMHYLEAGQGPVLILVHGLGSSAEVWRPSMMLLAKRYRVLAPDLPGYGKSDKGRSDYSLGSYAAGLGRFSDTLGIRKAAVAGNGMGGWIAALLALEQPEKVSHLILVSSAGLKHDAVPPMNFNPATRGELQMLLLAQVAEQGLVTPRMIDEQGGYWKEIRPTVTATLASLAARPSFLDDRLKAIAAPTLILWGRQDQIIPVDHADRFAKAIPGARLVVFDQAGHLLPLEQPAKFYEAVKEFVKGW